MQNNNRFWRIGHISGLVFGFFVCATFFIIDPVQAQTDIVTGSGGKSGPLEPTSPVASTPPLTLACGGSREGLCTWEKKNLQPEAPGIHNVPDQHNTGRNSINKLRGSTYAEVTMLEPGESKAVWLTGILFGEIEGLGRMRMRLSNEPSTVMIHSLDKRNPRFFPARAEQAMNFTMEVLDDKGSVIQTLVHKEAMKLSAVIQAIPPYNTEFPVKDDVIFEDVQRPGVAVVRLIGGKSTGMVKNPGGLRVKPLKWGVDLNNGQFTTTWRIENITGKPLDIHWFAGGIHGVRLQGQFEQFNVRIDKELTISLDGIFDPNDRGGAIVLHATSVPGAVEAEGHYPFYLQQSLSNPLPLQIQANR